MDNCRRIENWNDYMKFNGKEILATLFGVAVLIIAVGYVSTGGFHSVAVQSGTGTQTYIQNTGGSQNTNCPSTLNTNMQMYEKYFNYKTNPVTLTQLSTTAALYTGSPGAGGNAQLKQSATTSSTASINYTIACGEPGFVVGGNNGNVLENITTFTSTGGTQGVVGILFAYSAPTVLQSNAVTSATSSGLAIAHSVAAGSQVTSLYETIQAGANYTGNQAGEIIAYAYNSLAITSINLPGATRYTGTLPPITFTSLSSNVAKDTQNAEVAFVLPQGHYSQYITPSGVASGYTTFNPIIQVSGGYTGNTLISTQVTPFTNYLDNSFVWQQNQIVNNANGQALEPSTSTTYAMALNVS